jgi:hypothetical protein
MATAIPFYWFERADYDFVRRLIPNDNHLPGSFDQWEQRARKQIAQLEARGVSICKIMVDPKEYSAYCEFRGMSPSVATLGTFVMELSEKR